MTFLKFPGRKHFEALRTGVSHITSACRSLRLSGGLRCTRTHRHRTAGSTTVTPLAANTRPPRRRGSKARSPGWRTSPSSPRKIDCPATVSAGNVPRPSERPRGRVHHFGPPATELWSRPPQNFGPAGHRHPRIAAVFSHFCCETWMCATSVTRVTRKPQTSTFATRNR